MGALNTQKPTAQHDQWERRLQVRRRARQDGAAEQPPTGSAAIAPGQAEIHAAFAQAVAGLEAQGAAIGARLERDFRRLTPAPIDPDPIAARALIDVRQAESRALPALNRARLAAESARAEVETFKAAEGRKGGAKLPDSPLLGIGLVMGLIAIEAIASAPVFAGKEGGGLISAYFFALTVSGLNAGAGFLGGFFGVRYTRHRLAQMKLLGGFALLGAVVVGAALNLFVAQWRTSGEAVSAADASGPFAALLSAPSVVLLMLGGIVFILSMYKGATLFGDEYPDFGKLERQARGHEEAFDDALQETREDLDHAAAPHLKAIDDKLAAHRAAFAAMQAAFNEAADQWLDLESAHRALDRTYASLIALYRQENSLNRRTPAPQSFSAPPAPLAPMLDPLIGPGAHFENAKQELTAAERAAAAAIERLAAGLDTSFRNLQGHAS
jgi:hypothetical protein